MNESIVSPELTAMAAADSKAAQPTIEQRVAQQQLIVAAAFEANDYSKLAIASQQMLKLQNEQERSISAKLEAKLLAELAETLFPYGKELQQYNELRLHIDHNGDVKAVTLMNVVATAKQTKPNTASSKGVTAHGLPSSAKLLETHRSCESVFNGATFAELFEAAKGAKDPKNAVYQARVKLLKHCQTHKP